MNKKQFIQSKINKMKSYWYGIILLLGAILFMGLGSLDFFIAPQMFDKFLFLRVSVAIVLIILFYLNQALKKADLENRYMTILVLLGTGISAATIEIMVLNLGGHKSFYYAGFNLLTICVLGFVPLSMRTAAITAGLIYLIYLVPILLFDIITDFPLFISNNIFIIATFIIALVWRHLSHKNLTQLFSLQYDQKQHQETLEYLVDKRTKKLKESKQKLSALFEHANDGIIIFDDKGSILEANQKACELHGFDRESIVGFHGNLLETEENKTTYNERLNSLLQGESLLYETSHYKKDGTRIPLEVSETAINIDGVRIIQSFQRDITDKKKLLKQLLHSQKMESIGQLAGGLAHNFKNLLTVITANADTISFDRDDLDEKTANAIRMISHAGRQGTAIIAKLLSFSRQGGVENNPLKINDIIKITYEMISKLVSQSIKVTLQLKEPLPYIRGDIYHIEQLLINLMINARDAMPRGGELLISTDLTELDADSISGNYEVKFGTYVHIRVSDTGEGILPDHIEKIFEPFFTTKEEGKGTGLGLAMVYGIIKEHDGYISVSNNLAGGASFDIYLPVMDSIPQLDLPTPAISPELQKKLML